MHHFGVLVPSTNTTVETEYGRLLPTTLQVHVARIPLLSSGAETTPRSGDADVDYQARLLGSANVEVVALAQTAASLSADDYDDRITKRMREAAGVPAITSARAIGLAVRSLAARRITLVAPFSIPIRSYTRHLGRAWRVMLSHRPIGRTWRSSLFPAAIFRRCRSYPTGSTRLASPSSPPTRRQSGPCSRSWGPVRNSLGWGGCWKRCPRCDAVRHRSNSAAPRSSRGRSRRRS